MQSVAPSTQPGSRPANTEAKHVRILVVDDEANARTALAELLREEGYDVATAADGFKALGKLDAFGPHLVLTDLKMPGMDGIELMAKLKERKTDCSTIVMTAFGAIDTAVSAMRSGAVDYLTKPLNFDQLLIVVERAIERQRLVADTTRLRAELGKRYDFGNIAGESEPLQKVFKIVSQVAPSRATVLITGESGTGKELIANALHQRSDRKDGPFVRLHCSALAETLLESELFGHERGAFTGAVARRDGRFHQANGGTLFLDEIGEISPAVQVKLLRFLQEREFERVGGNQTISVDVRIIAATNRDLAADVADGRFREDLYYRLNVVNIDMPPLRDRLADVPVLAAHFLRKFRSENRNANLGLTNAALSALRAHHWPGNVRELENVIERAIVMCQDDAIDVGDLPAPLREATAPPATDGRPPVPGSTLAALEKHAIMTTLEQVGGSTSKAADILGVSARKIQYKLQEYKSAKHSNVDAVESRESDPPKPC